MQERRSTIRVSHRCRIQYCSSSDLLPRDGYLMNLSEQGAGMLLREPHAQQEQITISFGLPGEDEPVTATGVVRWSAPSGWSSRWHPCGLSWLPLEEAARHRLHRWMYTGTQRFRLRPPSRASLRWVLRTITVAAGIAIGLLGLLWSVVLSQENRTLRQEVQRRTMTIVRLEQREEQLQEALEAANLSLAATVTDIARLEEQTLMVEHHVATFQRELSQLQALYEQARSDRAQLMQRMQELDDERQALARQIASQRATTQLQVVMERAIANLLTQRRPPPAPSHGNQGYLLRHGHPAQSGVGPWIWVHEPEALR